MTQRARTRVRTLIVGQGLAGTALAWALERLDHSYTVIDEAAVSSSSRVAAGLITPVTGTRFTAAEHFSELRALAARFYRHIERRLDTSFFVAQPAIRLVREGDERTRFESREADLVRRGLIERVDQSAFPHFMPVPIVVSMPQAARLVTQPFLEASANYLDKTGRLLRARLEHDAVQIADTVTLPAHGLEADRIVYCGGYQDRHNPWLPGALFNPAKGEILDVRIEGLGTSCTVHALKSWLTPTGADDVYRFGSTYEHGAFEPNTTADARAALTARLQSLLQRPFEIIDHSVGIRPIAVRRKAIVGRHANEAKVAYLNGLGSKGALLAPYLATQLAYAIDQNAPLDVSLTGVHQDYAH